MLDICIKVCSIVFRCIVLEKKSPLFGVNWSPGGIFIFFSKLSGDIKCRTYYIIQSRVNKIWMWNMNRILFRRQLFQNAAIFEAWPGEKILTLFVADGSWNDRLSGFRGPWSLNWTGLLAGSSWMLICYFINYDWYIWL